MFANCSDHRKKVNTKPSRPAGTWQTQKRAQKRAANKAPSSNLQAPEKFQTSNSKNRAPVMFETWSLKFLWCLEVEIWSLTFQPLRHIHRRVSDQNIRARAAHRQQAFQRHAALVNPAFGRRRLDHRVLAAHRVGGGGQSEFGFHAMDDVQIRQRRL